LGTEEGATTPEEIIDAFIAPAEQPIEAMREATRRREEMMPHFLAAIDSFLREEEEPEVPTPIFYIFHLLGSWRATDTYRLLCRVLRADPDRVTFELGDALTETAHRVLANVYDGDLEPLRELVSDQEADEFARGSGIDAVGALFVQGKISRDALVAFLRDCRSSADAPRGDAFWPAFAGLIGDLQLLELRGLAEELFAEELIEPTDMTLEDLQRDFERGSDVAAGSRFAPFGDAAEELASWSTIGISDEELEELEAEEGLLDEADEGFLPDPPAVNPFRHVGRNDPCPCGSGKKFKKCCGG
jgi:hypothetical protein